MFLVASCAIEWQPRVVVRQIILFGGRGNYRSLRNFERNVPPPLSHNKYLLSLSSPHSWTPSSSQPATIKTNVRVHTRSLCTLPKGLVWCSSFTEFVVVPEEVRENSRQKELFAASCTENARSLTRVGTLGTPVCKI